MERASAYQNRIKALQMSHGLDEERTSIVNELQEKPQTMNGNGKAVRQSEIQNTSSGYNDVKR